MNSEIMARCEGRASGRVDGGDDHCVTAHGAAQTPQTRWRLGGGSAGASAEPREPKLWWRPVNGNGRPAAGQQQQQWQQ